MAHGWRAKKTPVSYLYDAAAPVLHTRLLLQLQFLSAASFYFLFRKQFHITEEEFWLTFLCRTVLIQPQWRILVFGLSRGGLANVFFQIKILLHSLSVLEQ